MAAVSHPEPKIVRIQYVTGNAGLIYATSPDLRGLVVARASVEELAKAVPEAICKLYEACGVQVIVARLEPDRMCEDEQQESWVAFPAELARIKLNEQETA